MAFKYRAPFVRRWAIRLLEFATHWEEGIWNGAVAAQLGCEVVDIEEERFYTGGLYRGTDSHDPGDAEVVASRLS